MTISANSHLSTFSHISMERILENINGRLLIDRNLSYTLFSGSPVFRSLIIGGYLRDEVYRHIHDERLTSKDIDVLVSCLRPDAFRPPVQWTRIPYKHNIKPFKGALRDLQPLSYGEIKQFSIESLGFHSVPYATLPVNVLNCNHGINSIQELVKTFDFGINQIAYDGLQLYYSDAFVRDMNNMTLTWSGKQTQGAARQRAEKRAAILAKRLKLRPVWPEINQAA